VSVRFSNGRAGRLHNWAESEVGRLVGGDAPPNVTLGFALLKILPESLASRIAWR
jgi:hypothetical protein